MAPDPVKVHVSAHAVDRARERLGIPRRSVQRLVEAAWHNGVPIPGYVPRTQFDVTRLWANGVFVFTVRDGEPVCRTVLHARDTKPTVERPADGGFGWDTEERRHSEARKRRKAQWRRLQCNRPRSAAGRQMEA